MNPHLKGNYPLQEKNRTEPAKEEGADLTREFEQRALERLGGSIAFVLKKNTFLWNGEEAKIPRKD